MPPNNPNQPQYPPGPTGPGGSVPPFSPVPTGQFNVNPQPSLQFQPPPQPQYQQPQSQAAPYNVQPNRQFEQFNQPVPQPQPSVPFFLDPHGPYAHIGQPPPRRRNKRKGLGLVIFGFAAIFVGGIIAIIMQGGGADPDALFQTAISNALTTKSYSQKTAINQDNIQLKQDVSDVKAPRQSGAIDLVSLNTKLEGYASIKNSYLRYIQFPDTATGATATVINKWEQVRKDGALPASYTATASFEALFDASTSIMGSYIIGNFSDSDREALTSLILTKGVYSYDLSAVTAETVDNQAVMRYDVKINPTALKEVNKKAGSIMGLEPGTVDAAITKIDPDSLSGTDIKMYVSTDTQRLVKVAMVRDGTTTSITYSSFNASLVANEPAADFQYDEYQTLLTGKASASLTDKAQDNERKSDINSLTSRLQAYYATAGFYPTLANLNDPAWRAANLKEAKDMILTDPQGVSNKLAPAPTPKQYSYQPYQDVDLGSCDGGACKYVKVSATLSDGSVYNSASN